MDLKEAELLFKSYGCSHFHMIRELDEKTYRGYNRLKIPRTLENRWANESMDKYYSQILEKYFDSEITNIVWRAHTLAWNWKDEYNRKIFNKILRLTNPQNTNFIKSLRNDYFYMASTPCYGLSYRKSFRVYGKNLYDYEGDKIGEIDIIDPIYFEEQRANVYCILTNNAEKKFFAIATLKNGADAIYGILKTSSGYFKIFIDPDYS